MKQMIVAASAAALMTFADFGLSKKAPQPVRRGDLDLSSPYIPPARVKPTSKQMALANERMKRAEAKRARKAARLRYLVSRGGLIVA